MKKFSELNIIEKLYSGQNIYLALYSVESFVSNKELLSENDLQELNKLKDKFDQKNITSWIKKVQNRLCELIEKDEYLKANVYFKPKKYDKEKDEIEFRPLHSATLLDQITAVSLLNILIYDFDNENKISMSSLSRLIPDNFYGNKISNKPEKLFNSWQEQYKKYTSTANELYRKFHENGEYKWEVNLDIKNFFPSINPICIYNYIFQQFSVIYSKEDLDMISKILEKLIFVKINTMDKEDLKLYTKDDSVESCEFALGVAQGMPQAYFLANIFMIEIEKIYKKIFDGEMLFYVDDSVIFTDGINDIKDFGNKIDEINSEIKNLTEKLYKINDKFNDEIKKFVEEKSELFKVEIHSPEEKSTISDIANSKEGEIYIHCIGRETSKTALEINKSFSDEESRMLYEKTNCILEAIERELKQVSEDLEKDNLEDANKIYKEAYKKKLIRYRKFFKNRNKDLAYRDKSDANELKNELISDLEFLKNNSGNEKEALIEFFEKYSDDTLEAAIGFTFKAVKDSNQDYYELTQYVKKLNILLFGKDNTKTSYIYFAYKQYMEDYLITPVDAYNSLKAIISKKKPSTDKKTDEVRNKLVSEELECIFQNIESFLEKYLGYEFSTYISLVNANSDQIKRQVMNAVLSYLLQIEISDDVILQKCNNRKITYSELRLLVYLRNYSFSFAKFKEICNDFIGDEYKFAIDYSIIQVLNIFKTYVKNVDNIDNLVLVHKYTCDIWKNGSKHLYFYTLHNQEHAVDLIQNSIKIVKAIDYIDISSNDYYILFIACYLHDISMVTFPNIDSIQLDNYNTNKIYSDFVAQVREEEKKSKLAINSVKRMLKEYYITLDSFYESIVRTNHAKDSANEIRSRSELNFIDIPLREIVAEVSEAHGYDVNEIYMIKSSASSKLWSQKFTKILLRLSDLLDMSSYRVSKLVFDHNLDNMGETSRFHWLSHLVTRGYSMNTKYFLNRGEQKSFLHDGSITEKIEIRVLVDLPQFTKEECIECNNMSLSTIEDNKIRLKCGEKCDSEKCNFLCKWFTKKNEYLFAELDALKTYLNSIPDKYFKTEIEVVIETKEKNILSEKQFTLLKKYVNE